MNKPRTSNKGILFVVSAPSGAGKTTVVTDYLKSARGISKTISHTTRLPRRGEKNGRDYHFVSGRTFRSMIRRSAFLEWTTVYGHYYGTSVATVRQRTRKGDVVLVIEGRGGRAIRKKFVNAVFILILPPSLADLKKRIFGRSGKVTQEGIRRLGVAKKEVRAVTWYDYVIVNDRLSRAVRDLSAIIEAERHKLSRHANLLKPFV
ncbi:MAG: guanylate kinase [Pseudomonadota bacterium]